MLTKSDIKRARDLSGIVKSMGAPKDKKPIVRAYFSELPPTEDKLRGIIEPLISKIAADIQIPEVEITPDIVKKIVQMMHTLPENDKLEVSKGIRNASSFIYGGTKYGTHELMHGGSSTSSTTTTVNNEVVAGSGTSWTLAHTPDAGTVKLYAIGQRLTPGAGNDYTISGTAITTANSWSAGQILADYTYTT